MLTYFSRESACNQIQRTIHRIGPAAGGARRETHDLPSDNSEMFHDQIQLIPAHIINQLVFPSILRDRNPLNDLIGFIASAKPVATSAEFRHAHHPLVARSQLLGQRPLMLHGERAPRGFGSMLRARPRKQADHQSEQAGDVAPVLMPPLRQITASLQQISYAYTLTNRAVSAAAMLSSNGTWISGWMAL